MNLLQGLKEEIKEPRQGNIIYGYLAYLGYKDAFNEPHCIARANATKSIFTRSRKHIYKNDIIVGSLRGLVSDKVSEDELAYANVITNSYGDFNFWMNFDHFSPDYQTLVTEGVPGMLAKIQESLVTFAQDVQKVEFLRAAYITVCAFQTMIEQYAQQAIKLMNTEGYDKEELVRIEMTCSHIANHAPETFRQALQLVWLTHTAFNYEMRSAMALGRIDQYLLPFYEKEIQNNTLTAQDARQMIANTFMKIGERRFLSGGDDTVNICIGGVTENGDNALSDLSFQVLFAVKECNIPGPNLSARITEFTSDKFLDEALQTIGTGLGYPALMNDRVNIAALMQYGYAIEDVRNYSMVGCIENFITGKQPPWTDGRFNTPMYLEYVLNNGKGIVQSGIGPDTGAVEDIQSMEEFLQRLERQLTFGAAQYAAYFLNENNRYNKRHYMQPFLSCFCQDCIGRGQDINDGGAVYPTVHGVAAMGIGTMTDSLVALEKVVFVEKQFSITEVKNAILHNFEGYEHIRQALLSAPKYGNNDESADKYAVWFVETLSRIFLKYKTPDGGGFYLAIAANTSNIPAGKEVAATPDGRKAKEPLSDAASPTYGKDKRGATSTINSVTKPDYTKVACGTVLNQKFSPSMFTDDTKRAKLLALIKVYFDKGGQELQINSVSREVLQDAMIHPEKYENLVVRVSGFSAYYIHLDKEVQHDILLRTQQS